jgi:hypothetical protein
VGTVDNIGDFIKEELGFHPDEDERKETPKKTIKFEKKENRKTKDGIEIKIPKDSFMSTRYTKMNTIRPEYFNKGEAVSFKHQIQYGVYKTFQGVIQEIIPQYGQDHSMIVIKSTDGSIHRIPSTGDIQKEFTAKGEPWPYFSLKDGVLMDESGSPAGKFPKFKSEEEAETYLRDKDIRGNVKPSSVKKASGKCIQCGNPTEQGSICEDCSEAIEGGEQPRVRRFSELKRAHRDIVKPPKEDGKIEKYNVKNRANMTMVEYVKGPRTGEHRPVKPATARFLIERGIARYESGFGGPTAAEFKKVAPHREEQSRTQRVSAPAEGMKRSARVKISPDQIVRTQDIDEFMDEGSMLETVGDEHERHGMQNTINEIISDAGLNVDGESTRFSGYPHFFQIKTGDLKKGLVVATTFRSLGFYVHAEMGAAKNLNISVQYPFSEDGVEQLSEEGDDMGVVNHLKSVQEKKPEYDDFWMTYTPRRKNAAGEEEGGSKPSFQSLKVDSVIDFDAARQSLIDKGYIQIAPHYKPLGVKLTSGEIQSVEDQLKDQNRKQIDFLPPRSFASEEVLEQAGYRKGGYPKMHLKRISLGDRDSWFVEENSWAQRRTPQLGV